AEWEYCCRAGKAGAQYSFGDDGEQLEHHAWYKDNSDDRTHRVGMLKPNAWGLYDMHGNASEWCQDKYDPGYYKDSPVKDPVKGPPGGVEHSRVFRGGSWDSWREFYRCGFRQTFPPGLRFPDLGFRVVLVAPPGGGRAENGK